ncbi:hypothetical protein HDU87_006809 [Geranomyces variabilis]|uniref:Uncharacterized protein n=1 Tax=Geranomyces variabilis TaxID=109894 RepID=A0AAD5TPU4_9FUNG|nr:hypothetical protein HDU87_006809 [Geranomyces variabilis]
MSTAQDKDEYGAPITLAAYGTSFSTSLSDLSGGAGSYIDLGRGDEEDDDNDYEEDYEKNAAGNKNNKLSNRGSSSRASADRGVRDTVTAGSATIAKRTAAQDGRGKGVRFGQSMEDVGVVEKDEPLTYDDRR